VKINSKEYKVVEARPNKCYNKEEAGKVRNGADIAVLVLEEEVDAADATPIDIWNVDQDGSEIGKTFRLLGYGDYGIVGINTEDENNPLPYGKLHTG